MGWEQVQNVPSRSFVCGHCGESVAPNQGYENTTINPQRQRSVNSRIYICHHCSKPTFIKGYGRNFEQVPGSSFGEAVGYIETEEVQKLYDEARSCVKVGAYTAAAMCCRKLLMNLAVSEKADENKAFAYYVTYLAEQGLLPARSEAWLKYIKDKGNEANHEIRIMSAEEAEQLIEFTGMILKIMYEHPAKLSGPQSDSAGPSGSSLRAPEI